MAEGYDQQAYDHVPQRSRRDKLRVLSSLQVEEPAAVPNYNFHNTSSSGSFPLFDPSLIPSAAGNNCVIKEERSAINHFMGFPGNCIMVDHDDHHQSPTNLPINSNPFVNYPPENGFQSLRDLNDMMVFNKLPEPLSLSLSSRPLEEINLQRYGPAAASNYNAESCRPAGSSVPLGPFTGYASILKASRFLKPVQQLLEEFCEVEGQGSIHVNEKIVADPGLTEYSSSFDYHCGDGGDDQGEGGRKKSRLISMLDEVCRRYKQYFQQMQAVVASFECVPGLGNATPYVTLAMKSMSKHFKYLKNAISDQHQFTNKAASSHSYSQRPTHNTGLFLDNQPVWRPQRGLPERAVNVLRAWLFEHFLHPYPTDSDKLMLAKQTGLSRSQVSNWFINARVRLWKPMVEEIHMLETRQSQKASQSEGQNANQTSSSLASHHQNMSTSTQPHALNSKRNRNELTNYNITTANEEMQNLCYSNFPHHASMAGGGSVGSNGGVSLTLGLQQNINGIGGGQGYGLGLHEVVDREGYVVMSGFHEAQNRHFGRDVIGGQLLHDFVG